MVYGSKEDLILSAMVGFYLNDLWLLRMLARVPIISAYDPSRESMLAYASPSNKIARMMTGLVIDCLGTNDFLVDKCYPLLLPCNLFVVLSSQSTHSFILAK